MLFRKYLAFVPSTFPCIWICLISWFLDRLLVEFGHRTSPSKLCTHNDLQYVNIHQWLTGIATFFQIIWSIQARTHQFKREASLMGIQSYICHFHIYILQTIICVCWSLVVVCQSDVSPWLCIDWILDNRASLTLMAISIIIGCVPVEAYLWDRKLQNALREESEPFEIWTL